MIPSVLLAGALALGGWGTGCGPVGPSEPEHDWRRFACDPGRSYLFQRGVQVAAYDHVRNIYRTYDAAADTWGPPGPPPWRDEPQPIAARAEKVEAVPNYGVDVERLNGHRAECYRLNGSPVSPERARHALAGGSGAIPDDAGRLRLTVIGDAAATTRLTGDLASAPSLGPWKDRLVVQAYPPEHWAVARGGFYTGGRPTIYVQAPSGKVLHRQDDYADGADGLAQALRRADPNYDPAKDPDLRKARLLDLSRIPLAAWILAAGLLFLVCRRA